MTDPDDAERSLIERVIALEETVAELEATVTTASNRDLPLLKGTIRAIMVADIETLDELPDAGRATNERLQQYDERLGAVEQQLDALGDVETSADTKAEKVGAVLAFAVNKRNGQSKVAVTPKEVKGCTGVSRRYAYELVETIGDEVDGVAVREPKQVETGSGTKRKGKALLIDCDVVHGTAGGVNSFTTPATSDTEVD